MSSWALSVALCILVAIAFAYRQFFSASAPYPPGPKGLPFIGNVSDMPKKNRWFQYSAWRKTYGDVIGLRLFGKPVVILNSAEAIIDLLEKRGAIYSDRPSLELIMNPKWGGLGWLMSALPYGSEVQAQRRMMMQCMNANACLAYYPDMKWCAMKLANDIMQDPKNFPQHISMSTAKFILRVAYGYPVSADETELLRLVKGANIPLSRIPGGPGGHVVDMFPSLSLLPPRVFGKAFSDNLAELRRASRASLEIPYARGREQLILGQSIQPSMISILTGDNPTELNTDVERSIKAAVGQVYTAGSETTDSNIVSFVLAMVMFPEVQKAAQKAIDVLLNGERLPNLDDKDSLPIIQAILLETMRWNPSAPLAIPHRLMKDDTYRGWMLPKGTLLIPNTWECTHDTDFFPEPEKFKPERFLDENGKILTKGFVDPRSFGFGYGRRICPGRYLAEATLWTSMATLLATFDISEVAGCEEKPSLKHNSAFVGNRPQPFECDFKPRSQLVVDLLKTAMEGK